MPLGLYCDTQPAQAGTGTEDVNDRDFSAVDPGDENIHANSTAANFLTGTLASQTWRNDKRKIAVHTIYSLEHAEVEKPDNNGKINCNNDIENKDEYLQVVVVVELSREITLNSKLNPIQEQNTYDLVWATTMR